jgi:hypothetical protein
MAPWSLDLMVPHDTLNLYQAQWCAFACRKTLRGDFLDNLTLGIALLAQGTDGLYQALLVGMFRIVDAIISGNIPILGAPKIFAFHFLKGFTKIQNNALTST